MLLLGLWNYIRGYVIIFVEGYYLEKFINICTHRQIYLWDIRRHKKSVMTLNVSINGFKQIRPVAKKANCRVRIMKKKGMPFLFNRYRRRKTFVVGAAFFVLIIYVLTSFIWVVEIEGNKKLETQYIEDKLAEMAVKPGVLKYNIDTEKVVNSMMMDINDLAWVSIAVKGTKIKVQLVERKPPPELISKNIPCNIIAAKDGIIKSIIVKDGQEVVKEGDTVTKGQVLISGVIKSNKEENARMVHAIGTVKARTWYEEQSPVVNKFMENIRTGRFIDNHSIVLFTKKINLFPDEIKFENYDRIEISKRLAIGEDIIFPFEHIIDRYYENSIIEKEINVDDAKQLAANNAHRKALEKIPEGAAIIKEDLNFVQRENNTLIAKVTIECLEDIGVTHRIGGE